MTGMQIVNNPYEQPQAAFNQNAAYVAPQQPQMAPPQATPVAYPQQPVQQQFPAQPQFQAPAGSPPPVPQVPQMPKVDNGLQAIERKQCIELPTQSGQPLDGLNLVMMTGYFHHIKDPEGKIKFTETATSARLGFHIAEKQSWVDKNNVQQNRVVWHRAQAWNDFARVLTQVIDGTPIKVWGNLTLFYMKDDAGNITGSLVEIKVNKFEFP